MVVKKNGTVIAAVRTKSITWNGTVIDATSDDDGAATTALADEFASTTLVLSCSGLTSDDVLSDVAFATADSAKHLSDITLERPNGDVIAGTFVMTSYVEDGEYQEATRFDCTLERSGIHTWTPAA